MNVFADYLGHSDLYYSLHLLFEKRLKANLFRPIGPEWSEKGFLNPPSVDPAEEATPLNLAEVNQTDDIHYIPVKMELEDGYYTHKAITFSQFLRMDFDLIVTTFFEHERIFHKVLKRYKPNTAFIRQIGNIHEKPLGFCKNILLAQLTPMPPNVNYVIYHPEHYEGYCYTPPTNHNTVNNFANHLPSYPYDLDTWNKCESSLRGFTFKMYGTDGRDGPVPHLLMPQAMRDSAFVWHVKAQGGGGFVARQALASGRPCIIKKKYAVWHDELAKELFVDSVNCIDLDLGVERGIEKIREWSQPDSHIEVCKATAEKFKRDINFADEAERIKEWINNLRRRQN